MNNTNPASSKINKGARFLEGRNDTVIDTVKRLLWLKKDTWQLTGKWMNWVQAREFSEEFNKKQYAGFQGWRMPTADEARSLFDKNQENKDHMGQVVRHVSIFEPGFGFLCWTSTVRNKIQAIRFGYRKGHQIHDDIYRTSRGSTRLVRDIEKEDGLI
ncbi:MAG: DUF1566 domain-containing protein [Nitrospinaceae bacterium]